MNNSGQRSAGNKTVTTRFAIAVIPTRQANAQGGKQDQEAVPTVSVSAQEMEQRVVRSTPALDKDCGLGSELVKRFEEAGVTKKVDENLLLNAYHTMLGAFFRRFSYHRALGNTGAATIDAITLIEAYDRARFPQQPTPEQNNRLQLFNHWALATQPMRSRFEFKVASDKQSVSSATENFCAASLKACIAASRYLSNDWNTVSVRTPDAINLEFLNLLNSYILMFVAAHVAFVDIAREPACTAHLERLLTRNNANLEQLQGLLDIALLPCFRVAADGQELVSEMQNEFYLRLAAATDSALMISDMHLKQVQLALKSTDFTTAATIAALSPIQELLVLTHQDYTSLDRAISGRKEIYNSVAKPPEKVPHNKPQKRKSLNPNNRSAQTASTSTSSAATERSESPNTTATTTESAHKQPAAESKKAETESTAQTASTSTSSVATEQTNKLPSTAATTTEATHKQPAAASKKAEPQSQPKQVGVKKNPKKQTKKPPQKAPAVAPINVEKKVNAPSPGPKSVSLRPAVQTIDSKELGSFTTVQTKKDRRQQAASSSADTTAESSAAQPAAQSSAVADSKVVPTSSAVAGEQRAAEVPQQSTAVATRSKATSSQAVVTRALAQSSSVHKRAAQPVKPTPHTASTSQPASNAATENYWHKRAAEAARLNAASHTATTSEATSTQSPVSNGVAQTSEQRPAAEVAPLTLAQSPAAASTSETTNTQSPTTNGVVQTSAQQQTAATDKNDVTVTTKIREPLNGRGRRHSFSTLFAETEKVTRRYVKNTFIHIPTAWK